MTRYDVNARFARDHLRTGAQRAVYFTLVAQLAESWSALELAHVKDLDLPTVQAILDQYTVAGIVEVIDGPEGSRYHWQSDMTYLYGSSSAPESIDPVCGMTVDESTPYRVTDTFGRRWLFCARVCMTAFQGAAPSPPDVPMESVAPARRKRLRWLLTIDTKCAVDEHPGRGRGRT